MSTQDFVSLTLIKIWAVNPFLRIEGKPQVSHTAVTSDLVGIQCFDKQYRMIQHRPTGLKIQKY